MGKQLAPYPWLASYFGSPYQDTVTLPTRCRYISQREACRGICKSNESWEGVYCINLVFRCLACKLVMCCSPVILDVKYSSSVVETQRVPRSLKRSRSRTFLQGFVTLSKRSGVKRSQSFRTTAEKRRREAGVAMSSEAKFLEVEDTRPRKSSGSSLHEMLSLRFGRGEKTTPKEKKPRRDPTPTRGLRSSKKQQQTALSPQPPALTLDR